TDQERLSTKQEGAGSSPAGVTRSPEKLEWSSADPVNLRRRVRLPSRALVARVVKMESLRSSKSVSPVRVWSLAFRPDRLRGMAPVLQTGIVWVRFPLRSFSPAELKGL